MTYDEFYTDIVTWIRDRWPTYGAWTDQKAAVLAFDFADIPVGVAREALMAIYNEGKTQAPTPSLLRKECRRVANERGIVFGGPDSDPCAVSHNWAILTDDGATREVHCARCGKDDRRPRHEVPTQGEIEDNTFGHMTGRTAYENPDPYV